MGYVFARNVIEFYLEAPFVDSWQLTPATIISARVDRIMSTRDGTKNGIKEWHYAPKVEYQYEFNGKRYQNDRVGWTNNYNAYGRSKAEYYIRSYENEQPIYVYVNPDSPARSVIEPQVDSGNKTALTIAAIVCWLVTFGLIKLVPWVRQTNQKTTE